MKASMQILLHTYIIHMYINAYVRIVIFSRLKEKEKKMMKKSIATHCTVNHPWIVQQQQYIHIEVE